jgi:hypothetical protein
VQNIVHNSGRSILGSGIPINDIEDEQVRNFFFFATTCILGKPSPADFSETGRVIWPVNANLLPQTTIKTFTQTNKAAESHTDSGFRLIPEGYFVLWCMEEDKNGGGISGLKSNRESLNLLSEYDLTVLLTEYRIKVPPIFSQSYSLNPDDYIPEFISAPLLNLDPFVLRLTFPNIDSVKNSQEQIEVACRLKQAVADTRNTQFIIQKGSFLITPNWEQSHSRSAVLDPNRLLFRIRYN